MSESKPDADENQQQQPDAPLPLPVVREELGGIPELFHNRLAFVLHNVLSAEECSEVIAATEAVGFKQATIRTGFKTVEYKPELRQGENCYLTDPIIREKLFSRVRDHLPKEFRFGRLVGLNERLTVLRYEPGGFFGEHTDGTVITKDNSAISFITVQLYLNEAFEGGETTFFPDGLARAGTARRRVQVKPRTGSAAVFEHKILHEGSLLSSGVKLTLRADVMYSRYFPPDDGTTAGTDEASTSPETAGLDSKHVSLPWEDRPAASSSAWSYCAVQ